MDSLRAAYEKVVYPSAPRAATAPDRLAAVATLFGMKVHDPRTARVLEIGCSDGGNLAALAVAAPQARFLGIDFSAAAVTRGEERWREVGLRNIELRGLDLTAFPEDAGTFDYIIAHGFYSWVPEAVREALLAAIQRHLAPDGVAYIDYNAQPGSQIRYAFRESILYHTRRLSEPQQRIDQARSLLKLIADASPPGSHQRMLAEAELARLVRTPDTALFHDMLAGENQPFYFHEFAAAALRHGLDYLAEADVHEMSDALLDPTVRERLSGIRNLIEKEQYLDILKGRSFRQTLLCHSTQPIDRRLRGTTLRSLSFSAAGEAAPGEREDEIVVRLSFGSIRTVHPQLKAVLAILGAMAPARISFSELSARLPQTGLATPAALEAELAQTLLNATLTGMVQIHAGPAAFTTTISPCPLASPLARLQAARGEILFTLDQRSWQNPDDATRRLLPLLDGSLDVAALARRLGWSESEVEAAQRTAARHALLVA